MNTCCSDCSGCVAAPYCGNGAGASCSVATCGPGDNEECFFEGDCVNDVDRNDPGAGDATPGVWTPGPACCGEGQEANACCCTEPDDLYEPTNCGGDGQPKCCCVRHTCVDGCRNGDELGVDCGGSCACPCPKSLIVCCDAEGCDGCDDGCDKCTAYDSFACTVEDF